MNKKRALITGITGQDGSYLAELLISKGYEVHGVIRRSSTFNTTRIDHIYQDPHQSGANLFLHYGDLTDGVNLTNLIREIKPDEVYNLAAQSHVQVSFTLPQYTAQVDAVGSVALLEAIRASGIQTKFYQASTSELFGSTPPPQSEESIFKPQSPYGAAKLMAYWCTVNYRDGYGIHATNGILFNHESPRRGETFVTRKITRAVARISLGATKKLELGTLSSSRDWGCAKDYVKAMWMILQHSQPDDFVCSTGVTHSIEYLCQYVFSKLGLNYKNYVSVNSKYSRPEETRHLKGDSTKLRQTLGWEPEYTFESMIDEMIQYYITKYKQQEPLRLSDIYGWI